MNESQTSRPRRVLVALDTSPIARWAIELATMLAAELRGDLEGLFFENDDLVKLAGLPFSREYGYTSTGGRDLSPASMRSLIRMRERELRRSLEQSCGSLRLQWSLSVVRERALPHLLGSGADADLLIIGVECCRPRLTVAERPQSEGANVIVVYDGSEASRRALELGGTAARRGGGRLVIMPFATSRDRLHQLAEHVASGSNRQSVHPVLGQIEELVRAIRRQQGQVVLVPRQCELLDQYGLALMLDALDCLVLLVR